MKEQKLQHLFIVVIKLYKYKMAFQGDNRLIGGQKNSPRGRLKLSQALLMLLCLCALLCRELKDSVAQGTLQI